MNCKLLNTATLNNCTSVNDVILVTKYFYDTITFIAHASLIIAPEINSLTILAQQPIIIVDEPIEAASS